MSQPTYPNIIPYLTVDNGPAAVDFYTKAFGAKELIRLSAGPDKIGHCELEIAGQLIMLADEMEGFCVSAKTLGGVPLKFVLMVEDTDASFARALGAGATEVSKPADQFYGFRMGTVRDPFGFEWMLQHEIEKLSNEQMRERWEEMMRKFAETGKCATT